MKRNYTFRAILVENVLHMLAGQEQTQFGLQLGLRLYNCKLNRFPRLNNMRIIAERK